MYSFEQYFSNSENFIILHIFFRKSSSNTDSTLSIHRSALNTYVAI
jgi:phage-related protein